jgi:mannose-6-phosphate isomerase
MPLDPIVLPTNRPPRRFYAGGQRIADFRGLPEAETHTPEDWVASTTSVRGQAPDGLTTLPDGRVLADAIGADPQGWLGDAHVARWGDDPKLLVKLLDAGQRLPVHAHPTGEFARSNLATAHGKAEAWYILTGGTVYVGLRDDADPQELRRLVAEQDTDALLALLHAVPVEPHDTVLVPPGTLHAIGEGVLLAEVQEPEDLSILLEWRGFEIDGATEGHLGLGFDRALDAVTTRALPAAALDRLIRRGVEHGSALSPEADRWFRLDRLTGGDEVAGGFAVLIAEDGTNVLRWEDGELAIAAGTTVVVPAGAATVRLSGDGHVLVARPPAP